MTTKRAREDSEGTVVAFAGKSGSGKSALCNALLAATYTEAKVPYQSFLLPEVDSSSQGTCHVVQVRFNSNKAFTATIERCTEAELRQRICSDEFKEIRQCAVCFLVEDAPTSILDVRWKSENWNERCRALTPETIVFRSGVRAILDTMLGTTLNVVPEGKPEEQRQVVRRMLQQLITNPTVLRRQVSRTRVKEEDEEEEDRLKRLLDGLSLNSIVVTAPCTILQDGLCLLDTPGTSTNILSTRALAGALHQADIILYVLTDKFLSVDAGQSCLSEELLMRIVRKKTALWTVWHNESCFLEWPVEARARKIQSEYAARDQLIKDTLENVEDVFSETLQLGYKFKIACPGGPDERRSGHPVIPANIHCCGHVWPTAAAATANEISDNSKRYGLVQLIGRLVEGGCGNEEDWWRAGVALLCAE